MSTISTHVLDTSLGIPAAGIRVKLEGEPGELGSGVTTEDGRVKDLLPAGAFLTPGEYRLTFFVAEYFAARARESFYSEIVIAFHVTSAKEHYHVPLLLSPFGYSTYRGS
jgi:5-hydroxyisourate hydrolase